LLHPEEPISPTRAGPLLGLAASSISAALTRLRGAGLVDASGHAVVPELFWELAGVWAVERAGLAVRPSAADWGAPDAEGRTWCLSGRTAAAALGGGLPDAEASTLDFYLPGPVALTAALRRYGPADRATAAATVAIAPVAQVARGSGHDRRLEGWRIADWVAVGLDLAQDRSHGRGLLEGWVPRGRSGSGDDPGPIPALAQFKYCERPRFRN
jgi:hypothetical protein